MAHDPNCENATEPVCNCSCGGRLHGTKVGKPPSPRMGEAQVMDEHPLKDSGRPWVSPVLPSDLAKSRKEPLVYHDGYTFSEKDANETALRKYNALWFDLTESQKKSAITAMVMRRQAIRTVKNPDDDRIPIQTAGGRAETRYNRAYEEAPSHGIFGSKEKAEFAGRKSTTQSQADIHYKKNVRAWVSSAKDALRSNDRYRIAETAREVPYQEPGTEGITEHLGISQHMAQANVAGQHLEQSIAMDDERKYKEHKSEFASIVDTIDAQTKNWPE